MVVFFLIILGIAALLVYGKFVSVMIGGDYSSYSAGFWIVELIVLIAGPGVFLFFFDAPTQNDCCGDSAFFSPSHRITIYSLVTVCILAYAYSSLRRKLSSPLIELALTIFLLIGFILNIAITIQGMNIIFFALGNLPILTLFIFQLHKNHRLMLAEMSEWDNTNQSALAKMAISVLTAKAFIKYPLMLLLCLPVLAVVAVLLLLVGQKPDSMIRAFTDTYYQGFSQLNYVCENVQCGEHYLCSVAANGHQQIVKPKRYGIRNGGRIICNRQLLVSNAFEELIEQKFPAVHRFIRKRYNKVGDLVHRHYKVFNNRFFSDTIYIIMKPAEYFFLFVLYVCDKCPENRIALQYLSREDRASIKMKR